jgi:ribokinase
VNKLCVVGSLNVDRTVTVKNLPAPGETVIGIGASRLAFGGKGGNQACAAAKLDGDVVLVARVGDDQMGEAMRMDLAARGVDVTSVLMTPGALSGGATICVDSTGNNLIVVDPGANSSLTPEDVMTRHVTHASVLLCQLEIPIETVLVAAQRAQGLVILNPAPAQMLPEELKAEVDLLVPNRNELALLCQTEIPDDITSTVSLISRLPHDFDVVVTLGDAGALLVTRRGPNRGIVHFAAPRVDVLDTSGAGDAFCGALGFALTEGMELEAATGFAVAAASLSTTASGARGRFAARAEIEVARSSLQPRLFAL